MLAAVRNRSLWDAEFRDRLAAETARTTNCDGDDI